MLFIKLKIQHHQLEYMFNLTNISVKEFFQLNDQEVMSYVELQTIMKSKPIFLNRKAKDLGQLEFGQVAQLKRNISNPTFENLYESFKMVFGTKKMEYLSADIISYFYALNWIRENIISIINKEKALAPEPDPDLEMAGVKRLSIFGEMSILINLGQKFSKTPTEIERWKYNLVFAILMYDKVHGEIQKNYMKIKYPKRGGKR